MNQLTEDDVREFADEYDRRTGEASTQLEREYLAACETLIAFLGPHWVFQHAFGKGGNPTSFLRANPKESPEMYRHQDRVIALADCLFNLQSISGIDAKIERLKRSDVESSVTEIEAAKLLFRSGIPIQFVVESGKKGCDYDLEATLASGVAACETKCKIETTELSPSTLRDALGTARKQLPADRPTMVFVKIPEHWMANHQANAVIKAALDGVFASTRRISAVVFHWEQWLDGHPQGAARLTCFRTEHNPRARYPLHAHGHIVSPSPSTSWRYLRTLV
jgi:hypothetical protein